MCCSRISQKQKLRINLLAKMKKTVTITHLQTALLKLILILGKNSIKSLELIKIQDAFMIQITKFGMELTINLISKVGSLNFGKQQQIIQISNHHKQHRLHQGQNYFNLLKRQRNRSCIKSSQLLLLTQQLEKK